jgi:hypothetical protein
MSGLSRLFIILCLTFGVSSLWGLYVQVLDSDVHDWVRNQDIDDNRSGNQFIGYNFDWSGVGRSSDGKWATMIGPKHFLSANHFRPGNGTTITFFIRDFSTGAVSTDTATVVGGQRIGSTDLWIGEIDAKPAGVTTYSIFSGASGSDYQGIGQEDLNGTLPDLASNPDDVTDLVFMVGRVSGDNSATTFRVGMQSSSLFSTTRQFDFGSGSVPIGDSVNFPYNEAGKSFSLFDDYEGFLQNLDSGGPTFYAPGTNTDTITGTGTPSTMLLFGIHAGKIGADNAPVQGNFSVDTLPGQYMTEINAVLATIPEPRSWALIMATLISIVVLAQKRIGIHPNS